jgi:prepilin-type N-terminal cleavage/methylation domain-containing protein
MMPRKQKQHSPQSSQAGFTIIESLMAIIVVTVLMVAIGPVIAMSVAARVQARRVERASEAAKTYVDGVRSGAIPATKITVGRPFTNSTGSQPFLNTAPPPTASNLPPPTQVKWSNDNSGFYCVDLDNKNLGCSRKSSMDLVIQAFRTAGDEKEGYRLGVRVYRADAFGGGQMTKVQQAALKGNLGDRLAPLATLITDIGPQEKSLSTWCDRLKPRRANSNSNCQ